MTQLWEPLAKSIEKRPHADRRFVSRQGDRLNVGVRVDVEVPPLNHVKVGGLDEVRQRGQFDGAAGLAGKGEVVNS